MPYYHLFQSRMNFGTVKLELIRKSGRENLIVDLFVSIILMLVTCVSKYENVLVPRDSCETKWNIDFMERSFNFCNWFQKLSAMRTKIANELPPESRAADSIRVSVRFPGGEHFERRFDLTNSLEVLLFFKIFGNYTFKGKSNGCNFIHF